MHILSSLVSKYLYLMFPISHKFYHINTVNTPFYTQLTLNNILHTQHIKLKSHAAYIYSTALHKYVYIINNLPTSQKLFNAAPKNCKYHISNGLMSVPFVLYNYG